MMGRQGGSEGVRRPWRWALLPAVICLAAASSQPAAKTDEDPAKAAADSYRAAHESKILQEFMGFLAIPDVATNPSDIESNAGYLESMLRQRGFSTRRLSAGANTPPVVFAELRTPGARRTVLYYAHYDGQPISQKGWRSEPFSPVVRTGALEQNPALVDWRNARAIQPTWRIYARAAGDDKASIEALLVAMDALKAKALKPSVNIKLFYEGEEEQGSPHLQAIVDQNRALLRADLIIMGDGPMHQSGRQLVNFGSRGMIGATLTIFGPLRPLHDGHYGSWAPSPAVEMAHLISSLRAENGDIAIPGFYDDVTAPSPADLQALAALPPVEQQLKHDLGLSAAATDQRLANSYLRPTLNIRSIHVGDPGENAANAIPVSAFASLDFRLTPGETPERVKSLLSGFLESQGWWVVGSPPDLAVRLAHPKIVLLKWDPGAALAVKSDLDAPGARAATAAIQRTQAQPVLRLPMVGASSGLAVIVKALGVPMVGVSIANYDDNQHAENENLRIANLWDGVDVYAALLSELEW